MAIKKKSHSRRKHGTPAIQVFRRHERIASESELSKLPLDQPMPDALRIEYECVTEMLHLSGTEDDKNIISILNEIHQYAHDELSKSEPTPQKLGWSRYGTAGQAKTICGDVAHQLLYRVEEAYSLLKNKKFLTLSFRLLLIGQCYMFLKTAPFNSHIKRGIKTIKSASKGGLDRVVEKGYQQKRIELRNALKTYLKDTRNNNVSLTEARSRTAKKCGVSYKTVERHTKDIRR